jgi:hypothetical protein
LAIVRERLFLPLAIPRHAPFRNGGRRPRHNNSSARIFVPGFINARSDFFGGTKEPGADGVLPIRMQGRFARLCFFDQLADAFEGRFIEYPVGKPSALATIFDRAETTQARSDSVSEQDGADRMEADDQRRTLPTHRWLGADGDADLDANECRV